MPRGASLIRHSIAHPRIELTGDWTLANLPMPLSALESKLHDSVARKVEWDLSGVTRLDSVGALGSVLNQAKPCMPHGSVVE